MYFSVHLSNYWKRLDKNCILAAGRRMQTVEPDNTRGVDQTLGPMTGILTETGVVRAFLYMPGMRTPWVEAQPAVLNCLAH